MEYNFEYKTNEERESIITEHSDLCLIEEQNITEGNFLIFVDIDTRNEMVKRQKLIDKKQAVCDYVQYQDEINLTTIENSILEIEKNKIINGGI